MKFSEAPKHPSKAYAKKLNTAREPSLVGKMFSGLEQHRPTKGYNLCGCSSIDRSGEPLQLIKQFSTKKAAVAFQKTLSYNTVVIGTKISKKI